MARIPEADIERLKQEISLQRLVEAQGIELNREEPVLADLAAYPCAFCHRALPR